MHSFGYRANALLTFFLFVLALMCVVASLSNNLNSPAPSAHVQVLSINWFQKSTQGNDEVSLWDGVIPSKELAKFSIPTASKYHFSDQGTNLRDKEYNLTLHWHVMLKTDLLDPGCASIGAAHPGSIGCMGPTWDLCMGSMHPMDPGCAHPKNWPDVY